MGPLTSALAVAALTILMGNGPEGLPDALRREITDLALLPAGTYTQVARWSAVGGAQHQAGRAAKDPDSLSGKVWEARVGAAERGKAILYGPYRDVPRGVYAAFVRAKLTEDAGEEPVADLDAVVQFGQNVCAIRHLVGSDFRVGRYCRVPIAFECPGGKLEIRVQWHGYAGIRLDGVDLYRVEGAGPIPAAPRAPEAVPSGEPRDLRLDATGQLEGSPFPRSQPPAKTLTVCDITREAPDVQLCALILQGLINRTRPSVYCLYTATDSQWLNWMRRNKWITATKTARSWRELLNRHAGLVRGLVVTDPALPATKNIANMIASAENCLVVSPRMLPYLVGGSADSPPSARRPAARSAPQIRLPVYADLRGRWKTSAEAYRWALDTLWPKLNHALAACSYPDHLGLRDYLTQHKAFIFWISGAIDGARPYANPTEEAKLAEALLARMPANAPIMSYPWAGKDIGIGEGPGVTLFAEFGKYLVGSINCTNLSVHSGIRTGALRPKAPQRPKLDPAKVYVSFIMSDGDNLPVLSLFNFPQLWGDPARGKTPIGWTVSPSAWLLMPDILSYYYSTATPADAFLGAVSGIGYTYPDSYGMRYRPEERAAVYDGFLDLTSTYMREAGLRSIWIMNASKPELIRRYAERIPGLEALYPDYGRRVSEYRHATYPVGSNVGVFHAVTGWKENATRAEKVAQMVEEIRSITPAERPAFLHAFIWNWGADLGALQDVMRELGPRYVAVRPDHMAQLYREDLAKKRLLVRAPGSVWAIEGVRNAVEIKLRNVGRTAEQVAVSALGGLGDARVEPESSVLQPNEEVTVSISGVATGSSIAMGVRASDGQKQVSVPVRTAPASEWMGGMPRAQALQFMGVYDAEALSHGGGKLARDPAAGGAHAWLIEPNSAQPGYAVYGPYMPAEPGRYLAVFRLKRSGEAAGQPLVADTATRMGRQVTSSARVSAADLPAGAYRCLPLEFDHPGGELETRLLWPGGWPLAVDWVAIWRIIE